VIKVLVVDDSPVVREFLVHILGSDPQIEVVGTATDGESAVEAAQRLRPQVITMDIHMPGMNGIDATRRIMETFPVPIIVVSGSGDPREVATTFHAMDAGAVAVLCRPAGVGHPDHQATAMELVQMVRAMSEVKVVRRWPRRAGDIAPPPGEAPPVPRSGRVKIVVIGASTGGPPALQNILAELPQDFPVPILIVQHMSAGFTQGFVQWLAQSSALPVHLAMHGEHIRPGHVYVAPDEFHMKVERGETVVLRKDEPEHGLRPSVSYLFRSVRETYGGDVVAGLLSGMGRDGADELRLLKDKGALTFVQDKDSCVVHGMPGEAIRLDAATLVLAPQKIAAMLAHLANNGK
jgi:two-component system chemotaxis response regulator CheB